MRIRAGFKIAYDCPVPTPMILMLSLRPERLEDLETPQLIVAEPDVPLHEFRDMFGNICHRLVAPGGLITFTADFIVADSGLPDAYAPDAVQHAIEDLPDDVLVYLLASRYCETELL